MRVLDIRIERMSDEEYFSDKYKDYISNSKLNLLNPDQDGSLEKYKLGFISEYNSSLDIGSAVHQLVLQPDDYILCKELNKPTAKLGALVDKIKYYRKDNSIYDSINKASLDISYYVKSIDNKISNIIKESLYYYIHSKETYVGNKEIIYLDNKSIDKVNNMLLSLINNKFFNIIYPDSSYEFCDTESFNEYAIFAEIEHLDNVIKIKGKIDNYTISVCNKRLILNDLKTTSKSINTFTSYTDYNGIEYQGSFYKYHYYRQISLYLWLLIEYYKSKGFDLSDWQINSNILLVETFPEYKTKVIKINNEDILKGFNEFKTLIEILINYKKDGKL